MDKIKNMENATPFADAIQNHTTPSSHSQINILRDSNRELKLRVIELEQELKIKKEIINNINNITKNNGKKLQPTTEN
ncbi:MAG TPA: hypothetical protein DEG69_14005 [Flavobacteriaceae bacterium]|nr:hypothetical protein [Flavobacteriaceae bacterium]|tara:strand:+ start:173 stop:406 length:234 start_codon:yes stop_codon:yes gene_type:complete